MELLLVDCHALSTLNRLTFFLNGCVLRSQVASWLCLPYSSLSISENKVSHGVFVWLGRETNNYNCWPYADDVSMLSSRCNVPFCAWFFTTTPTGGAKMGWSNNRLVVEDISGWQGLLHMIGVVDGGREGQSTLSIWGRCSLGGLTP